MRIWHVVIELPSYVVRSGYVRATSPMQALSEFAAYVHRTMHDPDTGEGRSTVAVKQAGDHLEFQVVNPPTGAPGSGA